MKFSMRMRGVVARRWLFGVGVPVLCLALLWLALLALVPVIKQQLETRGSAVLGRTLHIGVLQMDPLSLAVSASDIQVDTADGSTAQFQIGRVHAAVSLESLVHLAPILNDLRVEQPRVHLTRLPSGGYDIDDLMARFQSPAEPAPAPSALPNFALYNVVLQDGEVTLLDRAGSAERTHVLRRLNLSIPFLSTLAARRDDLVQPRLAFELNGSTFDTAAQAKPFAAARSAQASLRITHLDATPYLTYLPHSLPVQLKAAVLDATLNFQFVQSDQPQFSIGGDLTLSGLRLANPAGAEWLSMQSAKLVLKDVQPLQRRVELESLTLTRLHAQLARAQDGRLNIAALLPPAHGEASPHGRAQAPEPAQPASGAWNVTLAQFALQAGQVDWHDGAVAPQADLSLAGIDLDVRHVSWPLDPAHATEFRGAMNLARVGGAAGKSASLHVQGEATQAGGTANLKLADASLALAGPYLGSYLVPTLTGTLQADLVAQWRGAQLSLQVPHASLRDFAVIMPGAAAGPAMAAPAAANTSALAASGAAARQPPGFALLDVQDLTVDMQTRQVRLGALALRSANVRVQREADGQLQLTRWLRPQPPAGAAKGSGAAAAPPTSAPAWSVLLAKVRVDDSRVVLVDQTTPKPAFLELSHIQFDASQLALDGRQAAPMHLRMAVRSGRTEPGDLRFDGSVAWAPVRVQGQVAISQLPVHAAAPYLMDKLRIDLARADASFKGQVSYVDAPDGAQLQLRGDGALDDVRVDSTVATGHGDGSADSPENLLNWTSLSLPGIVVTQRAPAPLRVQVGDVVLSDFFARLIVSPQGRLVLQDLVKAPATGAAAGAGTGGATATAPSGAAVAPVTPVTGTASSGQTSAKDPVVDVGSVRLVNGQVAFSDRFIQPNYSAELSALNGTLEHFGTSRDGVVQPAPLLQLRGQAQGSASLEVVGRVNPLARPLDLDIQAHVHDLELSPLSSYAAKYAGYGIEHGKLSVDLSYRIEPDARLTATNHIVLNQLAFGDAIPNAPTSLPVKLATALLADRDGVINLNVPVSGSLNDPQFSIWPIVWKIVGNLVTKALTSPFSLFSGGGDSAGVDLANVAFVPGTVQLSDQGREGLDRVATELLNRPSLYLTITGTASMEVEEAAMRRDRLNALVLAEKRRAAGIAGTDVAHVDAVTPEQYPNLLREVYRRSDIKKPRNLIGLAKDIPVADMEAMLLAAQTITPDAVRALALQRAVVVRDYLGSHQLPGPRMFLDAEKITPGADGWTPHAELAISHH